MLDKQISNFDLYRDTSRYHFDPNRVEQPGEWFYVVGRFNNVWQSDLDRVRSHLRPMSWATIKNNLGRDGTNTLLPAQELDIVRGGGDPNMTLVDINDQLDDYAGFQKIAQFFGLEQTKLRFHTQHTGQVFNYHIDGLSSWCVNKNSAWPDIPKDRLIRFIVMLDDWQPGQFYIYGNCMYDRWKAGEIHWFDWQNIPHATANASHHARHTLQISGVRTELTDRLLSSTMYREFTI